MIERINQKRQNQEGFTLVELLVVIVILGILAAIVVFAVGGITDKGDDSANKTDIAVLQAAEEAQFANTKVGPVYINEAGLVTGKFLRAASTKNDICLLGTSATSGSDYKVVPTPATAVSCGAGWTPAP